MTKDGKSQSDIDLEAVRRLLDALERDLAAVRGGGDVQVLRDEVDRLKALLESGEPHHTVRDALHSLRLTLEGEGVRLGQYVGMIGRILGM
jgi:hypothetical protein